MFLAYVLLFVAAVGTLTSMVYLGMVAASAVRFRAKSRRPHITSELPAVTLMKPLHGMEPQLRENLESFFRQDHTNYEIIFGTRTADDPALTVVAGLCRDYPSIPVRVVISGEPEWPNAKVCNLHSMFAAASNDYLIISDSDVKVGPSYIHDVLPPLLEREVGMVTC